jgi:hypothetical protein
MVLEAVLDVLKGPGGSFGGSQGSRRFSRVLEAVLEVLNGAG